MNFLRSLFSNVPGTSVTFNTANARKGLRSVPAVAGKVTTMAFKGTGNIIGGVPVLHYAAILMWTLDGVLHTIRFPRLPPCMYNWTG